MLAASAREQRQACTTSHTGVTVSAEQEDGGGRKRPKQPKNTSQRAQQRGTHHQKTASNSSRQRIFPNQLASPNFTIAGQSKNVASKTADSEQAFAQQEVGQNSPAVIPPSVPTMASDFVYRMCLHWH